MMFSDKKFGPWITSKPSEPMNDLIFHSSGLIFIITIAYEAEIDFFLMATGCGFNNSYLTSLPLDKVYHYTSHQSTKNKKKRERLQPVRRSILPIAIAIRSKNISLLIFMNSG